jgi:hypothetical protein
MKPRLYLDGCSFVWGTNLETEYNLNTLFSCEFDVVNKSRGGKSNLAIALDYYNHGQDVDIAVIGWTFATRFYLQYKNIDLDFFPEKTKCHALDPVKDAYFGFHKQFYKLFDESFTNNFSDMLVDNSYLLSQHRKQKTVFFTWEHRNTVAPLYYPHFWSYQRLPCGHLNQMGTKFLHTGLRQQINEQR